MATLVTGGTGFVGAAIVKELAARGHEVVSLDVMPDDSLVHGFLGALDSRVTFVTGDILDTAGLDSLRAAYTIDRVVHAAVFTVNRTDRETARSKDILDINLTGTGNLLELARVARVERFVYVSSGAAYGLTRDPRPDLQRGRPSSTRKPLRHYQVRQRVPHPALRAAARVHHRQSSGQHPLRSHGARNRPPRQYVHPLPVDRPDAAG